MGSPAKGVNPFGFRGFESHLFRHFLVLIVSFYFVKRLRPLSEENDEN